MTALPSNDPRVGVTHNRALCCDCGTLRLFSANAGLRNPVTRAVTDAEIAHHRPLRPHLWEDKVAWERWLADFKCATCKRVTRHALLRDCRPEYRDWEETDLSARSVASAPPEPLVDALAEQQLREEMKRLEGFGVRFRWRHCGAHKEPTTLEVRQSLFDLSWTITMNRSVPAQILNEALANIWPSISDRDRCEKVRWKTYKNVRYAEFTYLEPWVSNYVEATAAELVPQAVAWARSQGDHA